MKKVFILFCLIALLSGCGKRSEPATIAASTLPVYEFTTYLCQGTDITVTQLVDQSISCLHDYTLQPDQMLAIEQSQVVILSGGGLEDFLDDTLGETKNVIDASENITLLCGEDTHDHKDGHHHESDPHFWLSPEYAKVMAQNICDGLTDQFPQHARTILQNLSALHRELDALQTYGQTQLANLSCRSLITFHDGFAYFAEAFDLHILMAIEEESGSEASAAELIQLIRLVEEHQLPAVFTERNGSTSAASILSAETNVKIYTLDMAMSSGSYFDAMYHNIDTIKEALG